MATRLYFDQATTPPVSPAFTAEWDVTSAALRRTLQHRPTPSSTAQNVVITETSTTAQLDYLAFQLVSAPLDGNQTISGTLKTLLRAREASTTGDFRPQIIVKVVSGDGTTVRGTLYAGDLATTLANELTQSTSLYYTTWFPGGATTGATLSSVSALSGDRIVIEVGVRGFNTTATSMNATIQIAGYNGYTDATAAANTSTTLNPWVEFSQNLVLDGQLKGSIDASLDVDNALADWAWNAVGNVDMDVSLDAHMTQYDQRTFYGTLGLTVDLDLAGHLRLNEYQWLSGSVDASLDVAGDMKVYLGLSGSVDVSTEVAGHLFRELQYSYAYPPTIAIVEVMDRTALDQPDLATDLYLGPTTMSMGTTMRRAIVHSAIVVPEPPPVHVPPTPAPEDPPEAAIDVTPPVASGITLRALHGIVVDMETPTITDGKPSS